MNSNNNKNIYYNNIYYYTTNNTSNKEKREERREANDNALALTLNRLSCLPLCPPACKDRIQSRHEI